MKFVDARKYAVCRCNVGFSKISPDKHVDVCVDSDEDRGSTPLASIFIGKTRLKNCQLTTEVTTRLRLSADVALESLLIARRQMIRPVCHRRILRTQRDRKSVV